jgi:hypothetical protein
MTGSAKPDTTKPPDSPKPDTTKPDTTKPDTTKPDVAAKPDTTKPDVAAKPDTAKPDATKPDATKPDTTPDTTKPGANITRGGATAAMKLAPINPFELAKIKLQLRANWLRDTHGVATISFVLTEPSKGEKILFLFEYGYEVDTAPTDREEYKKWLATNKVLSNTMDRQRGVSWYLEGTDANGRGAFRYVAQFGSKKLICGGSLYRDSDSNRWGEYRDEIVGAAKQICETISLSAVEPSVGARRT